MAEGKRYSTRYPGIYYRLDAAGKRRYQISYTDSNNRRIFKTLPKGATEKDALRERAAILERMHRGERVVRSRMTVRQLAEKYLDTQTAHLRPKTLEDYDYKIKHYIIPRIGDIKLSDLSVADIADFVVSMRQPGAVETRRQTLRWWACADCDHAVRKSDSLVCPKCESEEWREQSRTIERTYKRPNGYKAWTIRGCLSPMSSMFRYAVRRGWMSSNPVRALEKQERPKSDQARMQILSSDEIQQMLAAATDTYRLLFTTAVFTGLRKGELLALEWKDVDLLHGVIHVRDSKTEAGVREVVIPEFLTRLLAGEMRTFGPVFPFDKDNVNKALTATLKRASVKHIRFHDLRHTFASILIGQGLDVVYVAGQLGHSDPSITLRVYAKLYEPERRKKEAREKMQEAFAGVVG